MTGVPKTAFAALSPASLLVMGSIESGEVPVYRCLTIDSASEDALVLADTFGLDAAFVAGVFEPRATLAAERNRILDFAGEAIAAWQTGGIAAFVSASAVMPATSVLATMAREKYLADNDIQSLDPFTLACPGDAVREISRTIEWEGAVSLTRTALHTMHLGL